MPSAWSTGALGLRRAPTRQSGLTVTRRRGWRQRRVMGGSRRDGRQPLSALRGALQQLCRARLPRQCGGG
eukprot:5651234-Alexandrium_andersonii.AAC.1